MIDNKINKKWKTIVFITLIVASLVRSAYIMYVGISDASGTSDQLVLQVFNDILFRGVLPACISYLCASIVYSMVVRRKRFYVSRNDFIVLTLAAVAIARLLMGIIEVCAIIDVRVYFYTMFVMDATVLSIALLILYFVVMVPYNKLNPVMAYDGFKIISSVYMSFLSVLTLMPCFLNFALHSGRNLNVPADSLLGQLLGEFAINDDIFYASIVACVVVVALWIVCLVASVIMKKKAENYVPTLDDLKRDHEYYDRLRKANPYANMNMNNQNPNQGGNFNQNPNRGGNFNQNPNQGGNFNQNPNQGGNFNQNPFENNNFSNQQDSHPFEELRDEKENIDSNNRSNKNTESDNNNNNEKSTNVFEDFDI